jgi:DNA-binding transcriptional LysR family regulator
MELRQLEYLVAVADEANFTRAAARLHVAQPGVSAQIRRLERELGQDLLDRSGRSVRPTDAGATVLPYARAALAAVEGIRSAVDELAGLLRGRVAVGMITACSSLDLASLLATFHQDHPGVEITLAEGSSDELVHSLRNGRLDLAWVGLAGPTPTGLATQVIVDEPLVAAVRHDHRLAARASITTRELARHPLVSLARGTGMRAGADAAFAEARVEPRLAFEATSPELVAQLAGEGLGVAVLSESVVLANADTLHPLAITRPEPRSRLELAWRDDGPTSSAARALIAHASEALAATAASAGSPEDR